MQKYYTVPFAFAGLSLITACGGASTGGADATVDVSTSTSFAQTMDDMAFLDELANANLAGIQSTPDLSVPASGTINYDGTSYILQLQKNYAPSTVEGYTNDVVFLAVGDATAAIDFGGSEITVTGADFFETSVVGDATEGIVWAEQTGTPIDGQITFNFTQDVAGVNSYTGTSTGSLTSTSGETISANLPVGSGEFLGASANYLNLETFSSNAQDIATETNPQIDWTLAGAFLFKQ